MLGAPIVAILLLGVLAAATDGDATAPTDRTSTPRGESAVGRSTDLSEPPARDIADAVPESVVPPTTVPPPAAPAPAAAASATETSEPAPPSPTVPPPPPPPVVNAPPPGPDRAGPAPEDQPPPPPGTRSTAVYHREFADPHVLQAHGAYWAFATQSGLTKVPTLRSVDLVNWDWVGEALHELPPWAEWGHTWAPSVLARDSSFVLYYTTRHAATGLQCISHAVSVLPQGPYLDQSEGPMICQTARGGSIDPSAFVDGDGRAHLLWKSEGTTQGEPTRLWVQPLSADGRHLAGAPTQLLERRLPWEFPIIENPAMALVNGRHHLFYSGNRWETAGYGVGHAVCDSVTGPCRRTTGGPVLHTRTGEAGPGGQELVTAPGGDLVLVHHAWSPDAVGYEAGGARRLHVSALRFDGDRVTVGGPWGDRRPGELFGDLGARWSARSLSRR